MKTAHHRFAVAILALLVLPVPACDPVPVKEEDPIKAELDAARKVSADTMAAANATLLKAFSDQLSAIGKEIARVAATGDLDGVKAIQVRGDKLEDDLTRAQRGDDLNERNSHLWKHQLAYIESVIEAKKTLAEALDLAVKKYTMKLEFDKAENIQTEWKMLLMEINQERLRAVNGLEGGTYTRRYGEPSELGVRYRTDADIARGIAHLKEITKPEWVALTFKGDNVTDFGMAHLKGLTNLTSLFLDRTNMITDFGLADLKWLTNLEQIGLNGTNVTDAWLVHLKGMTNLEQIWLDGTNVTDAGLVHLKGMTRLRSLNLTDTKVTAAGVKKLQQALPNCKIEH